jgi:hypothetical protein
LWPEFTQTKLGEAAFSEALKAPPEELRKEFIVERLLQWSRKLPARVGNTEHAVAFANAVLTPWVATNPSEQLRAVLMQYFATEQAGYGDPRLPGPRAYRWSYVSPQARGVLLRWLVGDTLRAFVEVLNRTADSIWRYRERFWMAYHEQGHIDEAWLVLGKSAAAYARRVSFAKAGFLFGRLEGGAAANQSVLLMKIGGHVFAEWSHNGSLRAYHEGGTDTPALYEPSYSGIDLRQARSLDFHSGDNDNPELRHVHSQNGHWQRKARDFIRRNTGLRMDDADILL